MKDTRKRPKENGREVREWKKILNQKWAKELRSTKEYFWLIDNKIVVVVVVVVVVIKMQINSGGVVLVALK